MPFGIRVKAWGFLVEVAHGVGDEFLETFWNNANNSKDSSYKITELTGKVFREFISATFNSH